MSKIPVAAVIPNYNMADSLAELLPQVIDQGYDKIYVLDDASTDHSVDVVRQFPEVILIEGQQNIGAGPNRNRIIGRLGKETIVHFIDADMRLITSDIPALASKLIDEPSIGFIGGLVYDKNLKPFVYNFGPRQSLRNDTSSLLHLAVWAAGNRLPAFEKWCRRHFKTLRAWPDPHQESRRRQVLWASEANMLIKAGVFESLGGYDPNLRDHEILDFALSANANGLKNYFDPSFAAKHTAVQVRSGHREISRFKAEFYIMRKRGFRQWISWSHSKYEPLEQFDG